MIAIAHHQLNGSGDTKNVPKNVYPGTTSFRPPKKNFALFYLLSSPVVLVIALYYLSVQEQQIYDY